MSFIFTTCSHSLHGTLATDSYSAKYDCNCGQIYMLSHHSGFNVRPPMSIMYAYIYTIYDWTYMYMYMIRISIQFVL